MEVKFLPSKLQELPVLLMGGACKLSYCLILYALKLRNYVTIHESYQ